MSTDQDTQRRRQQFEQAYRLGASARRAGRRQGDRPYRGNTPLVRLLADEWHRGYVEADAALRVAK